MKISWNEPKWSYTPRWKAQAISQVKATSWLRVTFWLFIFLPASVYFLQRLYPNRNFHWYILPIVFFCCGIFMTFFTFITHYINRPKITVDEEGIRLAGLEDNIFKKYSYDKMTSIEVVSNVPGNYSLSWHYEGKNIIRGLNQKIDITRLKMIIEGNSNLGLKIRQP